MYITHTQLTHLNKSRSTRAITQRNCLETRFPTPKKESSWSEGSDCLAHSLYLSKDRLPSKQFKSGLGMVEEALQRAYVTHKVTFIDITPGDPTDVGANIYKHVGKPFIILNLY